MATVRIGDFSGGTSEVLDPSLIAPNAAVASYNLDPRTGVFTPVFGLQEVSTTGSQYIDFIEHDNGHEAILAPQPRCYVRWGDYLLQAYDKHETMPPTGGTPWGELPDVWVNPFGGGGGGYPVAYEGSAAYRFNSATGGRTQLRPLGMSPVSAAENAGVSLAPIRATALTFKDGEHNLTGDVLLNIEAAADVPALQYQWVSSSRAQIIVSGDIGAPLLNVSEGDWIILPPTASTKATDFVGRPMCVVEVRSSEQTTPYGETLARPTARLIVSVFRGIGGTLDSGQILSLVAGSPFGTDGFSESDTDYNGNGAAGGIVWLFKRAQKTLTEIVALARSMGSRVSAGYIYPPDAATATSYGAEPLTIVQRLNFSQASGFRRQLYDYTVYAGQVDGVTLLAADPVGAVSVNEPPLQYDLVLYHDLTPGAVETGVAILGWLGRESATTFGLSAGVYKYAATRVDDWGRESAPWPYLYEDKLRPRIDATTEAAAESTLGALFVRVGGLPQVPADWKLNIYRTRADGAQYFFLRKLDTGADFVDTVSDWGLSVIPMLAEQNYPPLIVPVDEEAKVFEQKPPQFLCEYRGVLWAAYKNRLMFTAPGKFYGWPPGNWFLLPSTITGILPAGDVLLVFTKTRTFRLTGNTFSTADFRQVSDEYGCVAHRTAKLVDRRPFWCSLNGVATFDGVRVSIVTDGILADSSEQWKGATAACSYRGEYYLLLTPTRIEPTRTRKGEPIPNEIEPRQRYYLRLKPGAWVTHGVFTGQATDFAANPSDGKLYVVHGGRVSKMFSAPTREAGYWKSGLLHGGYKTLRKNAKSWFCTVTEGTVRVQVEDDRGNVLANRDLDVGNHFIDFKGGVFARGLSFAFTGAGVATEYGYDFQEGQAQ